MEELLTNSSNNNPMLECCSGTEVTFSGADLEALIGDVVCHDRASQKAGHLSSCAEAGEYIYEDSYISPFTWACFR